MDEEPDLGIRRDTLGTHAFGKVEYEIVDGEVVFKGRGPVRVMVTEAKLGGNGSEPTLRDLSEALIAVYGTDYGLRSATWLSRFTDASRQAASYRERRVLLAGDAAHVHYPVGGHGLNIGVQDAVNLGWKLAQVVNGISPETLLETYHDERYPVAARVLQTTMAQTALMRPDPRMRPFAGACPSCSAWTSRACASPRCSPAWTSITTSARDTRCWAPHARSRPDHRRWSAARVDAPACRSAGSAQPRSARQPRHHPVGGSGSAGRR
ncbi:MAG TPA: FAD-dependent monooxygenase [Thermoleophilaceae bacterium]|nr:FAD-dependent monooxygenase [Thermoleophilaceae bacterium]